MSHVRQNNRSAATIQVFCRRAVSAIGPLYLGEVTLHHIDAFRKALLAEDRKPATVNRHLAFVRMAFNKARAWSHLTGPNPAAAPGMLSEEHRERYLTPDEGKRLLAALAEDHDRPVVAIAVVLLMLTGARKSEVLAAK